MDSLIQDMDVVWTADLTVGCPSLDERNARLLDQLSRIGSMIAAADCEQLSGWLTARYDQLDFLLQEEEHELAEADYPELAFHQRLHEHARAITRNARQQLQRITAPAELAALACESCDALALWLPRHIVDADRLFFPYVDIRFRMA